MSMGEARSGVAHAEFHLLVIILQHRLQHEAPLWDGTAFVTSAITRKAMGIRFFFAFAKEENKMETPRDSMFSSSPYSSWK